VKGLDAWVRKSSDSSDGKFDGQVNQQFEFNSGREINHEIEESSFASEQVGDGEASEKVGHNVEVHINIEERSSIKVRKVESRGCDVDDSVDNIRSRDD
jgi:hypothetical protein